MAVAAASARSAGYLKSSLLSKSRTGAPLDPSTPDTAIVSATKTDSFPDPNNDGKAEPGDTITYDVNVNNTGAVDAAGVTFNDTIDPNTTLVPGSLKVSPLAFAESYNTSVNTPLNIPAPGVLMNDTGTPAPSAQTITAGATTQGGTVTLNADGSFLYTPATGFTGADTFTYTATNGLSPDDTATVTINVDEGPTVTATTPTNGANNVAPNTNITVTFSEPVNATTSSFTIECPTGSGNQAYALSNNVGQTIYTLDPVADLPSGGTCTVTVVANQVSDVDTFDPPDQMAANYVFSFGVKPVAVDDMETATGNVRINSANSGYSVLTNDTGTGNIITAYDATSAQGGAVNMNTVTGTFTYNPPRGFEGADSFNYTISGAGGSDQGTVVITVSDMVWFINNAPGACVSNCDGRLTNPYTNLAAFEADNGTVGTGNPQSGDNIFIYTGTGDYTAPLTLENNQRVIGQGATSSLETLAGITFEPDSDPTPTTGGAKPSITSAGNGVNLAQNDQLYGLAFSNTTGTAISDGVNVGTFLMSDIAINNTSGPGLSLTAGGTATATGVNTIQTTTGTALTVTNTNIGAGGLTFRSISSDGAANGIVLNNTGTTAASGALTVTGSGTAASGGTIKNGAIGISLTSTRGPSFTYMQLNDFTDWAIRGTGVINFTLANSVVSGVNGNNAVTEEGSVRFTELTGSASISSSSISGGFVDNLSVVNTTGTLDRFTISATTFGANSATFGNAGAVFKGSGTAIVKATIQNSFFTSTRGDHANMTLTAGTPTGDFVFTGNTVTNSHPSVVSGGGGIRVVSGAAGSNSTMTYDISNNVMSQSRGTAIGVTKGAGNGSFSGLINNNQVGVAATANSGSREGSDISVIMSESGVHATTITNNQLRQYNNFGIILQTGGTGVAGSGNFKATVQGNTISNPGTFTGAVINGIQLNGGVTGGDTYK
ncbi:MAG TPA: Ig-like domain-containing protein, partial [Pyrinomonadaceae bacterium]|nr:Ig-like domain-containing protein [Pyrinomonadaceae bacterium]